MARGLKRSRAALRRMHVRSVARKHVAKRSPSKTAPPKAVAKPTKTRTLNQVQNRMKARRVAKAKDKKHAAGRQRHLDFYESQKKLR